jgi:aconitate hydratase
MPIIDCLDSLPHDGQNHKFYNLSKAARTFGIDDLSRLPFSVRVLIENMLRHQGEDGCSADEIEALVHGRAATYCFHPARVLLQDLLGIPLLIDFAAMRDAAIRDGIDPATINPSIPVDFIIDHSLKIVHAGSGDARRKNEDIQFAQNDERFRFLRWCQQAFDNLTVYPPDSGIMHQINIEHLARVAFVEDRDGQLSIYPDTMIGTDSHTPMVNALGVVGWGVGGLDAEGAMLGLPLVYPVPEVVGIHLQGQLRDGITATDLVLTITERLRQFGVVGKFVEFHGPGLDHLTLADRATISNMAPEYGATCVYFPVDRRTIDYLTLTGRDPSRVSLIESYFKTQGLWRSNDTPVPDYDAEISLVLGSITPCIAGPRRPQDRVALNDAPQSFKEQAGSYFERPAEALDERHPTPKRGGDLGDGDVVIAAITSCTNTSNPANLIAAGLVAEKAVELGLAVKPWVKTSLAPGSKVVADYLKAAGLQSALDTLGFQIAGYGCTTCGGMSGPIDGDISDTIETNDLVCAAVLSGNRNFEGRIHPHCRASYLASPPLVVAYALAGSLNINLAEDTIGIGKDGNPVYLADIWPSTADVQAAVQKHLSPEMFRERYATILEGSPAWQALPTGDGLTYEWDEQSSYIRRPPYFDRAGEPLKDGFNLKHLRPLVLLGDSITTDHISPSSAILEDSAAGQYLIERGTAEIDFNSYGTRRGNFDVVARASFANLRLRNRIMDGKVGSYTKVMPDASETRIFEAAEIYKKRGEGLIVVAGAEYGCGSSRDTAAKGPWLLGVRAVLAISFERIHRSNLVAMGILPLQFMGQQNSDALNLEGTETYSLSNDGNPLATGMEVTMIISRADGSQSETTVRVRLDTREEIRHFQHSGILPRIYRKVSGT